MPRAKKTSTKTPSKSDFIRSQATTLSAVSTTKTSASTKPSTSKAAFVRGLPASTPAKDVVEQAKAAGIKLGVSYVYNIRGAAKMAARKKRAAAKSPAVSAVAGTGSWSLSQHAETLLLAVAAEIGLAHALDLLHAERTRVHSILRE